MGEKKIINKYSTRLQAAIDAFVECEQYTRRAKYASRIRTSCVYY